MVRDFYHQFGFTPISDAEGTTQWSCPCRPISLRQVYIKSLGGEQAEIAPAIAPMITTNDLHARLTDIFREVFDDDALILRDDMTADNVENWDSLTHVDLIVAIEKEFKIRLTTGEITGLKSVGQLTALVLRKTGDVRSH